MKKLDEFLKTRGIQLYPFQRKLLEMIASGNRLYVIFPRHYGREPNTKMEGCDSARTKTEGTRREESRDSSDL